MLFLLPLLVFSFCSSVISSDADLANLAPTEDFDEFISRCSVVGQQRCSLHARLQERPGFCTDFGHVVRSIFNVRIKVYLEDAKIGQDEFAHKASHPKHFAGFIRIADDCMEAYEEIEELDDLDEDDQASLAILQAFARQIESWFMSMFHETISENLAVNPPPIEELKRVAAELDIDEDELIARYYDKNGKQRKKSKYNFVTGEGELESEDEQETEPNSKQKEQEKEVDNGMISDDDLF